MSNMYFTCSRCGENYEKVWTDAEAIEEMVSIFGEATLREPLVVVCDDCWRMMVPGGHPIREN